MGFIYVIRNYINNKVYVGQTKNSVEERFKEHLYASMKENNKNKLYTAMREIGRENFYVEELLKCSDKDMNKFEQIYVERFDSIRNGYNTVYPCTTVTSSREYEDRVIELYKQGYSIAKISKECNLSHTCICNTLKKNSVGEREKQNNYGSERKQVIMYSKQFEPEKVFSTIKEAYDWLEKNTKFKVSTFAVYAYIDAACKNCNICYGHRWQLLSDIKYDGKYFRSIKDKEAYKQGQKAYRPKGKEYYIVDGALKSIKTWYETNHCVDCGKEINTNNTRCKQCYEKFRNKVNKGLIETGIHCKQCGKSLVDSTNTGLCNSCANVKAKGKVPKATKEELKTLLDGGVAVTEIAKKFDRTPSTIHYWIKSYGLR